MAGYNKIDTDDLFPSDDSMAIVIAQWKELTIVPSKALAIMSPKEVMPVRHQ
jgi:hypothetical protein